MLAVLAGDLETVQPAVDNFYNNPEENLIRREFSLQWHLTDRCGMRCKHCYLTDETKNTQREELTTNECYEVIDDFASMLNSLKCDGALHLTGGDPMIRKDFFDILRHASSKIKKVGILGNPTYLNEETVDKLLEENIDRYQLSLDGLEETHNNIRGNGAFKSALAALDLLVSAGINVAIMSTLTSENMNELSSVMELSAERKARIYAFARIVPIGEGSTYSNKLPSPKDYRSFLGEIDERYKVVKTKYINFTMATKDPLWSLYLYETGILKPETNGEIIHGCSVGISSLSLDVDGTVLSCRRLETPAGNVKENSLEEIFLNSPTLHRQRRVDEIEGCSSCEVFSYCRGCRAVARAVSGSFFSKDPQCWRV